MCTVHCHTPYLPYKKYEICIPLVEQPVQSPMYVYLIMARFLPAFRPALCDSCMHVGLPQ